MNALWQQLRDYWLLCRLLRSGEINGRDLAIRGMRAKVRTSNPVIRAAYIRALAPFEVSTTKTEETGT